MSRDDSLFGAWLKERRKALDLTQEDLAERIGCSPVTILKIEAGTRRPSKQLAELLATHLEISPEERLAFLRMARPTRPGEQDAGDRIAVAESTAADPGTRDSARRPPTNLQAQATPFVGRQNEMAAIRAMLWRAGTRLVTLTGAGGVGKTRLAIQVAAELLDDFSDGVFFVGLAPIGDSDLVVSAIAQALGHRKEPGRPLVDSLKEHLRDKQMLLVLDNFEHVAKARLLVSELLSAPQLKVLVTSRVALRVYGEHNFTVRPMSLPTAEIVREAHEQPALLVGYEAVRLFVERAQAASSDFALTADNAQAVAEICLRLDGLPLAIELGATRVKVLSPKAMLARLGAGEQLNLLTRGAEDMPARQRTLRGAIAWSYDLLDAEEKALFRRMSVFVGGSTMKAIAQCGLRSAEYEEGTEVTPHSTFHTPHLLDLLESLVDKSLLRQEASEDGEPRFWMLETIREYALERLGMEESGEEAEVRKRHAVYFLGLVEEAEEELRGPRQADWLKRLEREHDNLRAALLYSLEAGETEIALRMVGAVWQFWWMHGHTVEGSKWLDRALASVPVGVPTEEVGSAPAAVLAKALNAAGSMSAYLGEFDRARVLLERSLAQRQAIGDKQGMAASLNNLGTVAMQQGDYTRAGQLYEDGLALRRQLGDAGPIAMSLLNLGNLALRHGNYKEAKPFYDESLDIFRALDDGQNIAMALGNLGLAALYQDDYEGAEPLLEESLAVSREMGNTRQVALMLNSLTCVALSRDECVQARAMGQKSLAMYRELGDNKGVADCLQSLAETEMHLGEKDHAASMRAAVLLAAQDALREMIGYPLTPFGRPLYEQTIAVVRAQLDEAAWAQAWVEGHSMSKEEIIAYALRDVQGSLP